MDLVILTGGSGSRLVDIHQNLYQKIFINSGQTSFLQKMLMTYEEHFENFLILVHSNDRRQYEQIIDTFSFSKPIKLINFDDFSSFGVGTFLTLYDLRNVLPRYDVCITWSDIILDSTEVLSELKTVDNAIITDINCRHRLMYDGVSIYHANNNGNIPGFFYFEDVRSVLSIFSIDEININLQNKPDFAEYLSVIIDNNHISCTKLDGTFLDFGDMSKYCKYLETVDIKQRYFNDISILDTTVVKTALTDKGREVLTKELSFYQNLPNAVAMTLFPTIISSDVDNNCIVHSFTMSKVAGETVHDYVKRLDYDQTNVIMCKELYDNFEKTMSNTLHSISPYGTSLNYDRNRLMNDLKVEYYDVTLSRLRKIDAILPKINTVNNIPVLSTLTAILVINKFIKQYETSYSMIHGDTNTSNVFINTDGKFTLIDPRGHFGNTYMFGDKNYDLAKFLYGLTGYDSFNLTKDMRFIYTDGSITYDKFSAYELDDITDNDVLKFIVSIIWLKLPYYTINNINKAIVSYAHGLYLITKYGKRLGLC